jgi:hypothetical protein
MIFTFYLLLGFYYRILLELHSIYTTDEWGFRETPTEEDIVESFWDLKELFNFTASLPLFLIFLFFLLWQFLCTTCYLEFIV